MVEHTASATPLITFKNQSVLDWLEAKGIRGVYKPYATPQDVVHRHVFGHVPLWLGAFAYSVSEISLPDLSSMDRARFNAGTLSVAEMDAAGAEIVTYQVRKIN